MALSAAAATLNTAVDTLMEAWETYIETLTASTVNDAGGLRVVPVQMWKGDHTDEQMGARANFVFDSTGEVYRIRINGSTSDPGDVPTHAGGLPLFFKITNDAGDLT